MADSATSQNDNGSDMPERPSRSRYGGRGRDFRTRRKVCIFCVDQVKEIDYKDTGRLRRFLNERGKIEPRRKTGTCAKHQRRLSVALKRARFMALLPYTGEHLRNVEPGGSGGRGDSGRSDRYDHSRSDAGANATSGAEPQASEATPAEQPQPAEAQA